MKKFTNTALEGETGDNLEEFLIDLFYNEILIEASHSDR